MARTGQEIKDLIKPLLFEDEHAIVFVITPDENGQSNVAVFMEGRGRRGQRLRAWLRRGCAGRRRPGPVRGA